MVARFLMAGVLSLVFLSASHGQEVVDLSTGPSGTYLSAPAKVQEVARRDRFRIAFLKAVRTAEKKGTIDRVQARSLKVSVFTPAGRAVFHEAAIVQMALSSDSDVLQRTADGKVDRTAIDWGEVFQILLEKLIPFLLSLLDEAGI